jgi:hypothetical protein
MTTDRTDYQRGYYAATRGLPNHPESNDWVRGWRDGKMDLARLGKAKIDDDDLLTVKQRELLP